MNAPAALSFVVPALALAIPATLSLAAVGAPRRAGLASGLAMGLAALFALAAALAHGSSPAAGASLGVRVDALTGVMLLLVSALGTVVVRYSRTYLQGDPGLERYLRWLLATLGAVTALVIANDLLVIAVAWTATSLALHQLLTFYADRTAALVAAHKKFLVSRLADVFLVASLVLVHRDVGSFDLGRLEAWVGAHPGLTPAMQVAAVLLVVSVALRSAQLPFHGWLAQVMEAPTPVSALLHAGIVNVGGFVLIRVAPWVSEAPAAQLLLVVIGLVSAVVASLVMTTRVSVKVALAWSTCAQMGFMLVECGLGLWNLAVLHLVAHSLYKAHAFLSTGTAVDAWRLRAVTARASAPTWGRVGMAVLVATAGAALCVGALRQVLELPAVETRALSVLAMLVGLSLVPLLARRTVDALAAVATALLIGGVVLLYAAAHTLSGYVVPARLETSSGLAWGLVALGFVALFAVKATLQVNPEGRLARTLYPWLFAGLYLDERFTRLTFRIWPPRLLPRSTPAPLLHPRETLGAH